ncbi:MAG: GxxExxY protein [Chthoniobacterales bacterium]
MELRKSGKLQDEDLSQEIIGAAIEVHRSLGPGFLESLYEEALCIELDNLRIPYERQKTLEIRYLNHKIGEHRLDLLIASKLVVELKAVKEIEPIHFTIVRSYVKASNATSGIILNFSTMPLTIKRVGMEIPLTSSLSFLSS